MSARRGWGARFLSASIRAEGPRVVARRGRYTADGQFVLDDKGEIEYRVFACQGGRCGDEDPAWKRVSAEARWLRHEFVIFATGCVLLVLLVLLVWLR